MGLFCSTYNAPAAPAQPSYGEGMADAMAAQMNQLLGTGEYADIYKAAGYEGADLGDILTGVEAPIRKQTAQIDTDVLRQTILGDAAPQTARLITEADVDAGLAEASDIGKAGMPQPTMSYKKGTGKLTGGALTAQTQYDFIKETADNYTGLSDTDAAWQKEAARLGLGQDEIRAVTARLGLGGDATAPFAKKLAEFSDDIKDSGGEMIESQTFITTNPKTGEAFKEGQVVRAGEGMVDLLGDTRQVQGQVDDYASYVSEDPELQAAFEAENETLARRRMPQKTIEEWGQEHYETEGRAAGRELGVKLQDAGRQAGFDELGNFMGLSALAEDIGRGGQQRAREADIADVERLGGRATDAYRAQGDLSGALAQARGLGAGGIQGKSAIPSSPLFSGDAITTLADRAKTENLGISAISGGRMGDYDPLALPPAPGRMLDAPPAPTATAIQQQPQPAMPPPTSTSAAQTAGRANGLSETQILDSVFGSPQQGPVQSGQPALGTSAPMQPQQAQYAQPGGTDAFRSALMQQGIGALDQGLTARENRAIQEAARARATNMGRTFDQTASIKEAEDVIKEDNARRMQNRAFAQRALGQEVGIQQADLARGLQAQQLEMARQSAGADRQLSAEEKDIERAMRRGAMEEQFRQQGLGAERASAAQMVGLEQATSADPFQAILQRQGQNNLGAGGQLFGQAGYGLQSGPQYLNPESGLGFISNQATNAANMFNAQTAADATRSAGMFGGLGALGGGIAGMFDFCWVAREVYGAHNPAWLDFRQWMFSSAPKWFFKLYLTFGERFANFISNKPRLKARIRLWMDSKIGR